MIEHDWSSWGPLRERYKSKAPRKLLSLDGGGIRGVLTLEILERVESLLKKELRKSDDFRLSDYFDYFAGTSTGAIIASGLARGMSVSEIKALYQTMAAAIFRPGPITSRWKFLYSNVELEKELKRVFCDETGAFVTLEPHYLKSLLLVVVKNVSTDSAWPVSSNPSAKYCDLKRQDSNLRIPLWQLVRASTAAPVFFPPEWLNWDPHDSQKSFLFADGSITAYNNPAFLLFKMATYPAYRLGWETGESKMFIVSVGTGKTPNSTPLKPADSSIPIWENVPATILSVLNAVQDEQDVNCRTLGRCLYGDYVDSELGDMISFPGDGPERQFTYVRYNADLSMEGLLSCGLTKQSAQNARCIDKVESIPDLIRLGAQAADNVQLEHFRSFL